jgi:hypothetical protein
MKRNRKGKREQSVRNIDKISSRTNEKCAIKRLSYEFDVWTKMKKIGIRAELDEEQLGAFFKLRRRIKSIERIEKGSHRSYSKGRRR